MAEYRGKTVAVTGADGFIGSHLVEALVSSGARVKALACYNSFDSAGWLDGLDPEIRAAVEITRGDVRDPGQMLRFVEGSDLCFHLAALIAIPFSYEAPSSYVDVNVRGTLNVLEAARAHGLARVVQTSTSEVYGTALTEPMDETHPLQGQSPYSASKIGADMMAEAYARSFGLDVVTLRPFNTFGPRQSERAVIPSTIRQALDPACTAIEIGDPTPRRDFTFVTDTAAAFLAIGLGDTVTPGRAYNGGTGRSVSIGETVALIAAMSGTNKPVLERPDRMRPANSEVRALIADHSRLTEATGWRPAITLEEGIERTIAWWRERLAAGRVRGGSSYMR